MSIILDGTTGITTPGLTNTGTETLVNLTTTGNTTLGDASTDTLNVGNGGLIKDASGNVGIGVTPSAWYSSGYRSIQFGQGSIFSATSLTSTTGGQSFAYNGFVDSTGNWKYINSNNTGAMLYQISNSSHAWSIAGNGTAGNAITFTQAMTLDASGNLGVGTTSPTYKITVKGGNANSLLVDNDGSQYTQLLMQRNATANTGGDLLVDGTNGLMSLRMLAVGSLRFCTSASAGDGTERARIDSSGNLLVGATSNVTNAARLLVQTASDYQLTLNASTSSGSVYSAMNFTQAGTVKGAIYQDHANTRLTIQCNGSGGVYLASGATSWTANSDERLKDIIEPITDATNKVSSLRAVIGKYKTDEEGTRRSFLIAQDVQSVLPEAVTSGTLSRSEDTTEYLGVAYTDVIPLLVAAIKEQQSIINTLTDRISALEQK